MKIKGGLAVMVKTPGVSPLKTRLAKDIGRAQAEAFYRFSIKETAKQIYPLKQTNELSLYWALASTEGKENPLWAQYDHLFQPTGKLGDRLSGIYNDLLLNHSFALIIGGDAPHIATETYAHSAQILVEESADFVLGLSEDGGFYLVGGRRPLPLAFWTSVEYSLATTGHDFLNQLKVFGQVFQLPTHFDVDTLSDLRKLEQIDSRVNSFMGE